MADDRPGLLERAVAAAGNAEQLRELRHDDVDRDPRDEADENGAGEEVGDKTEADNPGRDHRDPRRERERGEEHGCLTRLQRRSSDDGRSRDRRRAARPHRQLLARPEQRRTGVPPRPPRRSPPAGGAPASEAYAIACGIRTAQTARPANVSKRSQRHSYPRSDPMIGTYRVIVATGARTDAKPNPAGVSRCPAHQALTSDDGHSLPARGFTRLNAPCSSDERTSAQVSCTRCAAWP